MVIELPKNASKKQVDKALASLVQKSTGDKKAKKPFKFFGSEPDIEDGIAFQKKARNEWK